MPKPVDIKKLHKALDAVDRAYMEAEGAYAEQEASAARRSARTNRKRSALESKYMPRGNA